MSSSAVRTPTDAYQAGPSFSCCEQYCKCGRKCMIMKKNPWTSFTRCKIFGVAGDFDHFEWIDESMIMALMVSHER